MTSRITRKDILSELHSLTDSLPIPSTYGLSLGGAYGGVSAEINCIPDRMRAVYRTGYQSKAELYKLLCSSDFAEEVCYQVWRDYADSCQDFAESEIYFRSYGDFLTVTQAADKSEYYRYSISIVGMTKTGLSRHALGRAVYHLHRLNNL